MAEGRIWDINIHQLVAIHSASGYNEPTTERRNVPSNSLYL
jgi:hypothetical protein